MDPAGVAGEPINLGLAAASASGSFVTIAIADVPSGWTVNGGTLNNGTWTVQTSNPASLTITSPADFSGAMLFNVTETWTQADGSTAVNVAFSSARSRSSERASSIGSAPSRGRCSEACWRPDAALDPRCEIASFYEPGVRDLSVGGDWHDAFTSMPGRLALVVGDVVGRGLEAASTMGTLRSAVRALAVAGFSPAEVLSRLDAFVEIDEAARMSTLIYADVDSASGRTRIACAGHPPALLAQPGEEPQLVWKGRSVPLGALAVPGPRGEETLELGSGAALLLYTDGLIERRADPIDSGLDRLLVAMADHRELPLPSLLDEVTAELLADEGAGDDVCVLALRLS